MFTMIVQTNIQNPERKSRTESRHIDEKNIVQWLGETFGIFRQLAAEWRRIAFEYYLFWNISSSNKHWRQSRFETSQETVVKKIINGKVSSVLISLWFASVYGATSSNQNCVSPLLLCLQKYKNSNSLKTYLYSTSHP